MSKILYSKVGDNYETKDPVKVTAQLAAKSTSKNLKNSGFSEVSQSRGESAFVWKQGDYYMASVIEGLGTKNLVADQMRKVTGKTYYDSIAHDTVATIINDLVSVGAKPLALHAYWAIENNDWLADKERMTDLISGWKSACNIAGVTWGGGETPTLKEILLPNTVELGGSAVGIIKDKNHLITDKKLRSKDRILLIKSTGVNANGLSTVRSIAKRLPNGYATKMNNGKTYGEAILQKSNIYARLINDLLDKGIDIHYLSNITGHGMRKIMRSNRNFTYILQNIFDPPELFNFIQKHANLSDLEMYGTFNMGSDYAIFLPEQEVSKARKIIKANKFEYLDAGYIVSGERKVEIKSKNIVFLNSSLGLKS